MHRTCGEGRAHQHLSPTAPSKYNQNPYTTSLKALKHATHGSKGHYNLDLLIHTRPHHVLKVKCSVLDTSHWEVHYSFIFQATTWLLLAAPPMCIHQLPLHSETTCSNTYSNSSNMIFHNEPYGLSNLLWSFGKGKCLRYLNLKANMWTTKSRWVVEPVPQLALQERQGVEDYSSSTLPNTWTWAISTTFMNL